MSDVYAGETVNVAPCRGVEFDRITITAASTTQIITASKSCITTIIRADGADVKIGISGFSTKYFTLLDGQALTLPYDGTALYAQTTSGSGTVEIIFLQEVE